MASPRPKPSTRRPDTALAALEVFEASDIGKKYPATAATWRAAWDRFIPFLEFAPAVRKVIYTTNSIESLNYQLRKIIKNRGHFPNDTAVVKLLWLSIRNIEDKRARERAKAATKAEASLHGKLIEGTTTQGWNEALGALVIAFPERFAGQLN
ncbi:MAG: transposase [Actinobacteria bacterium]|nr:transposase [Actinomycetota bacterium]